MKLAFLHFALVASSVSSAQGPGLQTQLSRAGDTVIARVNGAVPTNALKRLREIRRIQPAEDDTTLFSDVFEFKVDQRGRAWVADDPTSSIFLFDSAGRFVRKIGGKGAGPGEFQQHGGLATLRDGRIAHLDFSNARVSFFSPAGDYLTSWPIPAATFMLRSALLVDPSGGLRIQWRNYQWTATVPATLLLGLREGGAAFGDTIGVFAPDVPAFVYEAKGPGGRPSIGMSGPFAPSFRWKWHPGGGVASINGATGTIRITQANAPPVRIERTAPPVRVSADERAEAEASFVSIMRRADPNWTLSVPLATTKPALENVFAGNDGKVWVLVAGAAELIPDDERSEPRPNRPPPARWRSATIWEVFAPNGTFLGRVPFKRPVSIQHADGDDVWVIERTALGLPAVVRYRVEPALR